jgi:glutathione S-transferase
VRFYRGFWARPSRAPERPLELWSYEASPSARLVRERLCELELPYLLRNVALGSASREALESRQVPYLIDPNTGRSLSGSTEIIRHLENTYSVSAG